MFMKTKYEDLPLLPTILAEVVASTPYCGQELSRNCRDDTRIREIELKRQHMTPEQVRDYSNWCDRRCKAAYEARVKWFLKIVKKPDGREQLMVWLSHWLAAFLTNPRIVERE